MISAQLSSDEIIQMKFVSWICLPGKALDEWRSSQRKTNNFTGKKCFLKKINYPIRASSLWNHSTSLSSNEIKIILWLILLDEKYWGGQKKEKIRLFWEKWCNDEAEWKMKLLCLFKSLCERKNVLMDFYETRQLDEIPSKHP